VDFEADCPDSLSDRIGCAEQSGGFAVTVRTSGQTGQTLKDVGNS
jgi:hypothetical protein